MTDITKGVRRELVLRELGEAVLWLRTVAQGINNMDTAMRANHSGTASLLSRIDQTLLRIEDMLREVALRKPRKIKKRRK